VLGEAERGRAGGRKAEIRDRLARLFQRFFATLLRNAL
jgi:hypothetical protein